MVLSPVLKFSLLLIMMWTSAIDKKKAKFAVTGLRPDVELRELLSELKEIYKEGCLRTVLDREYPLEKVAEAHTYTSLGHKKGNVVFTVHCSGAPPYIYPCINKIYSQT